MIGQEGFSRDGEGKIEMERKSKWLYSVRESGYWKGTKKKYGRMEPGTSLEVKVDL